LNKLTIATVLLIVLVGAPIQTQATVDPIPAVERVVLRFLQLNAIGQVNSSEGQALLTGEALRIFRTPSIGPLPPVVDKTLIVDATHAVARVCAKTPNRVVDTYFHLERAASWKIAAFRLLAQTGITEGALEALKVMLKPGEFATADGRGNSDLSTRVRDLALTAVEITATGNVEVSIGGVFDNVVMLIFSPRKSPPTMSPSDFIWVEELAIAWYLARTT
jgi:hypothetical protein